MQNTKIKVARGVQIGLIILFGLLFLAKYFNDSNDQRISYGEQPEQAGVYFRIGYPFGRYYYPYYTYRYYPYSYSNQTSEVYVVVQQDQTSGENIRDLFIDGRSIGLNPPSSRGFRGSYVIRLNPGSHVIEWTVRNSKGKTRKLYRQFDVDYGDRINFFINGDEGHQE